MPRAFFPSVHLLSILFGVTSFLTVQAVAWDEHHLVTRASLSDLTGLSVETVKYTPFKSLLIDLGFSSPRQFNESIQIRKEYEFLPHLGEMEGASVSILDVLAAYSDEPDWGMDKEIFDQYPDLWRDEYSRMGGREGTPSQAFRHMYWPAFSWRMPLRTLKSPVTKMFSPMGLAPDRAALFIGLARKARAAGHHYWSARLVANALHYLEDVAQPFHASQTPTKRFLLMPLFDRDHGNGFENYLLQMQNIIAYYHYSFENYISRQMSAFYDEQNIGEDNPEGKAFVAALAGDSGDSPAIEVGPGGIAELVIGMAGVSVRESARAAGSGLDFFPPIEGRFDAFDPERSASSERWWSETIQNTRTDSAARREYLRVVHEMFSRLGSAVRSLVRAEVVRADVAPNAPGSERLP